MGAAEAKDVAGEESVLEELPTSDPAWDAIAAFVRERCEGYAASYGHTLQVKNVWRIWPGDALRRHESEASKLGKPTRLFHGTSLANAQSIARGGFRLPTTGAGLYGRGVYFADCPQKSADYAPESSWAPFFGRLATKGLGSVFWQKDVGQMLLCDVYLGSTNMRFLPRPTLDPAEDLKGGWLRSFVGLGDYNSVYANSLFGILGVPEYIVYQAHQGIPRYLLEFEYEHR